MKLVKRLVLPTALSPSMTNFKECWEMPTNSSLASFEVSLQQEWRGGCSFVLEQTSSVLPDTNPAPGGGNSPKLLTILLDTLSLVILLSPSLLATLPSLLVDRMEADRTWRSFPSIMPVTKLVEELFLPIALQRHEILIYYCTADRQRVTWSLKDFVIITPIAPAKFQQ